MNKIIQYPLYSIKSVVEVKDMESLGSWLSNFEHLVSSFLKAGEGLSLPLIILISFGGGLAASLTPCVLPMVPLYLSYIGATEITSKTDALKKSFLFCLGAAIVFSLMGVFASFASFITIEYRGYIHVAIGLFILLMSLFILEVIKLPLPQFVKTIPQGGPLIVGMAFALISSPCASPILFAVLALSSTVKSIVGSILIMFAYSLGYTGIIFLAGIFAGFTKQLNFFKQNSRIVIIVSGIILALLGVFYLYSGVIWFFG
ncbi:MAG: cytochrome c biogenesis protein CcdA [Candidatus Melainabacteria bacterium]|nr:cytochrome c biogenesis protein CcdA [Candidatus Melainabacteria bacterium]MBI3308123.1 cytochrome c biogenesis protein CcdA [Candidatus Melainabacteria bacterium]